MSTKHRFRLTDSYSTYSCSKKIAFNHNKIAMGKTAKMMCAEIFFSLSSARSFRSSNLSKENNKQYSCFTYCTLCQASVPERWLHLQLEDNFDGWKGSQVLTTPGSPRVFDKPVWARLVKKDYVSYKTWH